MIESSLIVQTGFPGDAVLATSMLRVLHSLSPSTRIGFVVRSEVAELFEKHPAITTLYPFDKGKKGEFKRLVELLKSECYQVGFAPHRSLRTQLLLSRSEIPRRIGFRQSSGSYLLSDRVEYQLNCREIDRNSALIEQIGLSVPHDVRTTWIAPEAELVTSMAEQFIADSPTLLVAPGSVWSTKRWPSQYYTSVCNQLMLKGYSVLLIGSPAERELCLDIATKGGMGTETVLAGRLTLVETAALIVSADLLLCNDSAPLHIAESLGKPVVALFGPTVTGYGFAPYLLGSIVLEGPDLKCRPCGMHGGRECPIGSHRCMHEIRPERVLETIEESLPNQQLPSQR